MQHIALIGLGPHARRIYFPYLERLVKNDEQFKLELIIDLEMNRETVLSFLSKQQLQPAHVIFLDTKTGLAPTKIDPLAAKALSNHKIAKAIIATEPKAHKIYLDECIKQGIPVVVDKPVTSPLGLTPKPSKVPKLKQERAAKQIYKDVQALQKSIDKHPGARVLVQCQRRNHTGYNLILDTITDIVTEFGVPITYIDIHHSDGMWNMPDEFLFRENHPYKYGYGKLMHSGYHFVDLLSSLIKINTKLVDKTPDSINVFSQALRPQDQHEIISHKQYENFFGKAKADALHVDMRNKALRSFGELDSYSQIQLTKKNRVITTAQLSLMQSGFSQRAWAELPEDTYKSNGRVRHEFINVHIGPLASIQVHSYQSTEISKQAKFLYEPGGKNHFDIYIFRNSSLIGGKPFEHIQFGKEDAKIHKKNIGYLGQNEEARHVTLDELMYDKPSISELQHHIETNKLIAAISQNHIKQHRGTIPYSKFKFKDIF